MAFFYYHLRESWQNRQNSTKYHPDFLAQLNQCHDDLDCQVMHRYLKIMSSREKTIGESCHIFQNPQDSGDLAQIIEGLSSLEARDKIYNLKEFKAKCQELMDTRQRLEHKFGVPCYKQSENN